MFENVRMRIIFSLLLALCCVVSSAHAQTPHQLTLAEKRADFDQLINQIKSEYGPRDFKKEHLGIHIDELARKYWEEMKATTTNGEFYTLVVKFVAEFRDGHFRAFIPSSFVAYLPFSVNLVENRVLIAGVNRDVLPESEFPFSRGDEVVSMDGRPVDEIISELMAYVSKGNEKARRGIAAYFLRFRPGTKMPVPSGAVALEFRSLDGNRHETIELEWLHDGEPFDEHLERSLVDPLASVKKSIDDERTVFDPLDLSSEDDAREYGLNAEESFLCNGKTRIVIPEDATMLIEEPFTVYYHPTPKGNIGYLRIPHYSPDDGNGDGKPDFEEWFEYYRWALTHLEQETVGLIIDQDHNCGGRVDFFENLVSLFMEEPFDPLTFQFRASKQKLLQWQQAVGEFDRPFYLERDAVLEVYALVEQTFFEGKYLTPKTTFRGGQKIAPQAVYTKPIIILIDSFAGSGGDAFPAMMQGNGRAKLLGTSTGGLGGHVSKMTPLLYSQIRYDMTQSLFFHPDGTPIENNGAKPDTPYEMTIDDFLNEYRPYQQFYLEKLLEMVDAP